MDSLNQMMLILAPLAGCMLLAYGVFHAVSGLQKTERQKVMDRLQGSKARVTEKQINFEQFRKQTQSAHGALAAYFQKLKFTPQFQRILEQANVPWNAAQTLVNLTAIASVATALLVVVGVPLLAALGVGAATFVFPILYLMKKRTARLKKFVNQLPDVFELLTQALRAGHSLASGMQLVAKEMPDPAGTEFGRVFHEQNLGLKVEDALRNLAERVDMLDVRIFVTAVLIQRQTGGDLAEVLDKIAEVIRDRIKLFGTVQALTAEGRLSGYVLLALPVVVFLVMLKVNSAYAELLIYEPMGRMMLTIAVVMQLMGWAMINKIVNIKV